MSDSFLIKGKKLFRTIILIKNVQSIIKSNKVVLVSIAVILFGLILQIWDAQPGLYAHAYTTNNESAINKLQSPLFNEQPNLFTKNSNRSQLLHVKNKRNDSLENSDFASKIYAIVGDAPIKEMIPFISKRNEKVAAFLVGIAKKESSFGSASPSKNGENCYNYWGYKGSAGNGSVNGYACFDSAEEAIETVGDRIEVLVNKDRNTPERMVNTWKCGTSCKGDLGAPGWVSTVALYFNKIVS
jgi:hypothetical protein